ncbi:alpha/beta hydrolase [Paenibacillus contaminans]|uniref:Alpha/beta hydrolase n=2 Tax=Paenibacillus contaminans TaxID=450362 RepID=A0A329M9F1_9BACL|nr:alpha/beta hydrolase [Paenibacillus contaminans]
MNEEGMQNRMSTSEQPTARPWIKWVFMPLIVLLMYVLKLRERLYRYRPEPLERLYRESGPYRSASAVIHDEQGRPLYRIDYPEDRMDACPVVIWGNGSDAQPENYGDLLAHLSSWGFTIVGNYCRNTGTGKEIADTVNYVLRENDKPTSLLYGKIRTDRIGAVGQSQGATGVLNANKYLEKPLQTVVTIALPALKWCDAKDVYEIGSQSADLFFMAGTHDFIISPTASNSKAYHAVRPGQAAVMAMTKCADHLESMGNGGMHRGYLTAWLRYRLAEDGLAATAFAGKSPEIHRNKGWKHVSTQNIKDVN